MNQAKESGVLSREEESELVAAGFEFSERSVSKAVTDNNKKGELASSDATSCFRNKSLTIELVGVSMYQSLKKDIVVLNAGPIK